MSDYGELTNLKSFALPNCIEKISGSFYTCPELTELMIPDSVNNITTDFKDCPKLKTILGFRGSYAETFAAEKGYEFVAVDEEPEAIVTTTVTTTAAAESTGTTETTTKDSLFSETTTFCTTTTPFATTTTAAETATSATAAVKHIDSDETLVKWAVRDYQSKHDAKDAAAEITAASDSEYEITLRDSDGVVLDVYKIDPATGKGTDSAQKPVNLPQTGNNSAANRILAVLAFLLTGTGLIAVQKSGIIRRKKDKTE